MCKGVKIVDVFDIEHLRHVLDSPEGMIARLHYLESPMSTTEQIALVNKFGTQLQNAVLAPFNVDVAKACHHGSSDFTVKYLKKVNPHVNVFSSGDNKSFDHPVADALGAAGQHAKGDFPLLFSTELARATSSLEIHFGLINARSNGTVETMAQMKEQDKKADVWDSFTVPWEGKFRDS